MIILTTFDLDEYVFEGLRAGRVRVHPQERPGGRPGRRVRTVAAGDALLAPSVTRGSSRRSAGAARLRTRRGIRAGYRRASARCSSWSPAADPTARSRRSSTLGEATVKTHLSSLFAKLGLRDRVEAVIYAYESGLVEPGSPDSG